MEACQSCGAGTETLYEVAGRRLCSQCIAPPADGASEPMFTVERVDDLVFEYDHRDGTLRLAWPGRQAFLAHNEVEALCAMLKSILA